MKTLTLEQDAAKMVLWKGLAELGYEYGEVEVFISRKRGLIIKLTLPEEVRAE